MLLYQFLLLGELNIYCGKSQFRRLSSNALPASQIDGEIRDLFEIEEPVNHDGSLPRNEVFDGADEPDLDDQLKLLLSNDPTRFLGDLQTTPWPR